MSYDPNDPRLSAYALDEMPAEERQAFESGLDAADRAEIAALREVSALLREGLAQEPMPSLTEPQREAIRQRAAAPVRRRFRWVVWLAAAAGFAVLAVLVRPGPRHAPVLATRFLDEDDARAESLLMDVQENLAAEAAAAPAPPAKGEDSKVASHLPDQTRPAAARREKPAEAVAETHFRLPFAPSDLDGSLAPKPAAPTAAADVAMQPAKAAPARERFGAPQKPETPPPAMTGIGGMGGMGGGMLGGIHVGDMGMAVAMDNPFLAVREEPVSRFRIVAATAMGMPQAVYQNAETAEARRFAGRRQNAVPGDQGALAASVELAPCPWAPPHWLARLTIRGRDLDGTEAQVDWQPSRIAAYRLVGVPVHQSSEASVLYELIPAEVELGRTVAGRAAPLHHRLEIAVNPRPDPGKTERLVANVEQIGELDGDFAYAAAVAAYAMVRSGSSLKGEANLELVERLARAGIGQETEGPRHEFLEQVRQARAAER